MEINIIVAYAIGLILLYIIGWFLLVPIKIIGKLIWNGILGGILLFLINIIGGFFHFYIAINPISALIAGLLGIPGVILLIIINMI